MPRHWNTPIYIKPLNLILSHNSVTMWKCKTFVSLLLLISTVQGDVIENILVRLDRVYDYILTHHDLMNIDTIFGVVLSQGLKKLKSFKANC